MLPYLKASILPDAKSAIIFTAILTVAICVGTLTPLTDKIGIPGSDKWHHFIAFTALGYPLAAAGRLYWIPALIYGLCLGALIEITQPYVNRFGDVKDFQADTLGVLFGIFLGILGYQVKSKSADTITVDRVKEKKK
jgi:VanZ family protein